MDPGFTIFAIDFDGTIVDHQYPNIGNEKPFAVEVLKALQAQGDKIIIWTCRDGEYRQDAVNWLEAQGFIPDAVNENVVRMGKTAQKKIYCHYCFDDRNWPTFPGWEEVALNFIEDAAVISKILTKVN